MKTQCIKHVITSVSKLGQCSTMLFMNKFTKSDNCQQWKVFSLPYLNKLTLVMWYNLDNENLQPNYEGPPQCLKGFCQPKPLSHFASWVHFLRISVQTWQIMSENELELNKYRILKMTVIFNGLTWPIFKRFHHNCYMVWLSTSMVMAESATFSIG